MSKKHVTPTLVSPPLGLPPAAALVESALARDVVRSQPVVGIALVETRTESGSPTTGGALPPPRVLKQGALNSISRFAAQARQMNDSAELSGSPRRVAVVTLHGPDREFTLAAETADPAGPVIRRPSNTTMPVTVPTDDPVEMAGRLNAWFERVRRTPEVAVATPDWGDDTFGGVTRD